MELEPVVSYSPIPPDNDPEKGEERVEPRLTVLPLERKRRTASVAPPSAEEAAGRDGDIEDAQIIEAEFVAPPRRGRSRPAVTLEDERPRRRFPIIVMLGLVALVLGIAVLAFTFTRIMNSSVAVTPAATVPASDVAAPADDSGSAGPGVITLPPEATAPSAADAAAKAAPAAVPASDSGAAATAGQPPPLPRLRPANDTGAAPAAAAAPAEATPPPAAPVVAPAAATAPAAGQSSDSDVDSLMQDVGRILAAPPPPSATTAPADVTAGSAPAVTAPAAAGAPGAASTADYPPLPAPSQPLRRRWFEDNGPAMPVPPADIPDPEGAAGQ